MKNATRLAAPRSSGVYLIAFYKDGVHAPYCGSSANRHASALHYCGYADNISARLRRHRKGAGGKLCRAVVGSGYELRLVRLWLGATRAEERAIKRSHNLARHCPICKAR